MSTNTSSRTLAAPVKMRSKSTAPSKRLAKSPDLKDRLGMAKDGQPGTHNIKLIWGSTHTSRMVSGSCTLRSQEMTHEEA